MIGWIIFGLIIIFLIGIIKKRKYFWKDKEGKELTFKQFMGRWKQGYQKVTPAQQIRITLWSFIPMFIGIIWGMVVTFLGKTYWLTLILTGSLPITSIQFLSNLQKYQALKATQKIMEELENE